MDTPLTAHEEYERELLQFISVLHDLLLSGANLSAKTIDYILRHVATLGEGIGNFPTSHPIFVAIANSSSITLEFSRRIIELSHHDPKVYSALAHNDILSEEERTLYALNV